MSSQLEGKKRSGPKKNPCASRTIVASSHGGRFDRVGNRTFSRRRCAFQGERAVSFRLERETSRLSGKKVGSVWTLPGGFDLGLNNSIAAGRRRRAFGG